MKIKSAGITNFLSIGKAELNDLSSMGLTLIQGDNRDDPSADSNGAGKSSIADALCWCLYGETARGDKGDEVVNNIAGKGTCVAVELEDDGGEIYRVERYRKHPKGKNKLLLYRIQPSKEDLTAGTTKATQALIEKVIGCSYQVFKAGVYSGQEQMVDLPAMTDKALKELVEEAAGIDRLQEAHEIARKRLRDADAAVTAASAKHDAKMQLINSRKQQRADAQARVKQWEADHEYEVKQWEQKVNEADAALDKVGDPLQLRASIQKAEAIKKRTLEKVQSHGKETEAEIAQAQSKLDATRQSCNVVSKESDRANMELATAKTNFGTIARKVIDTQKAIEAGKPVDPCGSCGRAMDGDEARDYLQRLKKELDGAREAHSAAKLKAEQLAGKLALAQAEVDKAKAVLDVAMAKRKPVDMGPVNKCDETIARLNASLQEANTAAERLKLTKDQYWAIKNQENPHSAVLKQLEAELRNDIGEAKRSMAEVESATEQKLLCEKAAKVFSPSGVRAYILDTVTPYLNERTAYYLGALSDGAITATWSTVGMTKAGELREQFGIDVVNDKGAKQFRSLSGGEKRKVRLSTSMALQDLVATRATKPIDLLVADEIDDALDAAGLERLMGVLEQKARERGTVLIISHNSLRDWIRNVMLVTKENGASTIQMAA